MFNGFSMFPEDSGVVEPNRTFQELEEGLVTRSFDSCAFGDPSIYPTTEERFLDGRLLCNGTDACSYGTGQLEFRSSSDYLDCRGCLWMDSNERFGVNFHRIFVITNHKRECCMVILIMLFSGPHRTNACRETRISGAGAICCQSDSAASRVCGDGSELQVQSGGDLQNSICCSGVNSCDDGSLTGAQLSCDGDGSCSGATMKVSQDLRCNGANACGISSGGTSSVTFTSGSEYPGFAFRGIF